AHPDRLRGREQRPVPPGGRQEGQPRAPVVRRRAAHLPRQGSRPAHRVGGDRDAPGPSSRDRAGRPRRGAGVAAGPVPPGPGLPPRRVPAELTPPAGAVPAGTAPAAARRGSAQPDPPPRPSEAPVAARRAPTMAVSWLISPATPAWSAPL